MRPVTVIGAGLAGCEAAWTLSRCGIPVHLYEQKPLAYSPAHHSAEFAELVCSNSLKAMRLNSAAGLLKEEMRRLGSVTMEAASQCSVGAGGALAVDRERFSYLVTQKILSASNITVFHRQVERFSLDVPTILSTGPLTSPLLVDFLQQELVGKCLSFFDAAAPIVTLESLNQEKIFFAARYGRGEDDYINCPFDKERYEQFYDALVAAEQAPLKEVDREYFKVYEGCMPIEVMAKRGAETLRYGPLKPVGLRDPHTGHRPWAVVQLRKENAQGSLYNLVGFQTNLKFPEQKRVFSLIPGLENAEFVRYGVMHRNTFLDSPRLLSFDQSLRSRPNLMFAGQMTGVEGYIESAASGITAGLQMACRIKEKNPIRFPRETMIGALLHYISDPTVTNFQPMGCNIGILPVLEEHIRDKALRNQRYAERALEALQLVLDQQVDPLFQI